MNTEIFNDNVEMRNENGSSNTSYRRNSESYSKSNYHSDSKYFLICKSCFWCASCLNRNNRISKCPVCVTRRFIELIVTENVELRWNLLAMIVNIIQEGNLK